MSSQASDTYELVNAQSQDEVVDDNDAQAQYTDDGMGSTVRQFVHRGRARKTKADSADAPKRAPKAKAVHKTASKGPAVKETMPKKRKAAAQASRRRRARARTHTCEAPLPRSTHPPRQGDTDRPPVV